MTTTKSIKNNKKNKVVVFMTADGKMRVAYGANKKTRLPVIPVKKAKNEG